MSKQRIMRNVDEEELQKIASHFGVIIKQHGDIIEIEGDPAAIDEAIHDITELDAQPSEMQNDDILHVGAIINGNTSKKQYFKYLLIEYDANSDRWLCDIAEKKYAWRNGKRAYQTNDIGKYWVASSELLNEYFDGRK